jgi:hypothetical protein
MDKERVAHRFGGTTRQQVVKRKFHTKCST